MSDSRFNSIKDGSFTVVSAGVRKQLTSAHVPCRRVLIQSRDVNVSAVVVGGDTVVAGTSATARGIVLNQGVTFQFNIENLNKVWINGRAVGDKLTYVFFD